MRTRTAFILILLLAGLFGPPGGARAAPYVQPVPEYVTPEGARAAAETWIAITIRDEGSWGGAPSATVIDVQPFLRGERQVGYFVTVDPQGYIVLPLRTELPPVKAFHAGHNLDPTLDGETIAGLLKDTLAAALDRIEAAAGPVAQARTVDFAPLLDQGYTATWAAWTDPTSSQSVLEGEMSNYSSGQILLETAWHQGDPYWTLDPIGVNSQRTVVGCVATAGAQVMAYWDWPPYGSGSNSYTWNGDDSCEGLFAPGGTLSATFSDTYDWAHMANRYIWDAGQARWEDEDGNPLTTTHLNAARELSYEVGVAVEMDYGVCASGQNTYNMDPVYSTYFRYADADVVYRADYTAANWFAAQQVQYNLNRPVQYRVAGHSIVGDGWRISGALNQVHYGYGWSSVADNTWYTVDNLTLGDPPNEYMVRNIVPNVALGATLATGTYVRDAGFPYRYFDRDVAGGSTGLVTFASGQMIQFLPRITVRCNGNSIRFLGAAGNTTRLFARGDPSKGIAIYNGGVRLYTNGNLRVP